MNRKHIILVMACMAAALFTSCIQEKVEPVAKAVLGDQSILAFSARNPQAQTVTVYSDGPWHTTAPEWINVSPDQGDGVMEVTITAEENVDASGMLEPRKGTVILSGNTIASQLVIQVSQEGDAYRNAEHKSVSQVTELSDGKSFIIDEAKVVALSASGCILTDGTNQIYVTSGSDVAVGDAVSVKGVKGTINGVPAITETAEMKVLSSGAYEAPEAVDITEQLASFDGTSIRYVSISGIVSGGNLAVIAGEDIAYAIKQVDSPADLAFSKLNGHKAQVKGYTCGILGANMYGIIVTELIDKGLDQLICFEDDFEWVAPWAEAASAGDAVATNNPSTTAPNVFTTAACEGFLAELVSRGYGYFEGQQGMPWTDVTDSAPGKVLYLQSNYLKFGKSDWNSGITLPAMASIENTDNVMLEFDWCWQITGSANPDIMTLTVEIVGKGVCAESSDVLSPAIESAQSRESGASKIEWQHAKVALNGIDKDTRIKIRPTNYDPYIENPSRGQNRWYLDNIKVVPAEGGSSGGGGAKSFEAVWSFDPNKTYEKGVDYDVNQKTGSWIKSDDGLGVLSVNRVSDTDASKISTFTTDETWGTTVCRLLSYSVYLNDYWMFEVPAPKHPAGKCNVKFNMSSSAAGPKVFVMEYSTDGENWEAFNTKKTQMVINKDGETPYEVTYTYIISPDYTAANECCEIDQTFDLPASIIDGTLYVRARVNDTIVNDRSKMLNGATHGGTNRIGKFASVTFTAK